MRVFDWLKLSVLVGIGFAVYAKLSGSFIPDIAGAVDRFAGSTFWKIIVPEGPNSIVIEYYKAHGLDEVLFMRIARGETPIPDFLQTFIPSFCTVGMLFQGLFAFINETKIGDVEQYYGCGLPGSSGTYVVNDSHYADATLWKTDTLENVYTQIQDEHLYNEGVV